MKALFEPFRLNLAEVDLTKLDPDAAAEAIKAAKVFRDFLRNHSKNHVIPDAINPPEDFPDL